jgi:hypothetical protein
MDTRDIINYWLEYIYHKEEFKRLCDQGVKLKDSEKLNKLMFINSLSFYEFVMIRDK